MISLTQQELYLKSKEQIKLIENDIQFCENWIKQIKSFTSKKKHR